MVGCAGPSSETSKEQEPTEVAKKEQTRSAEATASEEDARCDGTRTIEKSGVVFATNDLPDCPNKGGLLSGTDKIDNLAGEDGDDEIRGLGARDVIFGGDGNDVIYAGPGDDSPLSGENGDDVIYGGSGDEGEILGDDGADVIYGGDGNDTFTSFRDGQRDELYCGKGKDYYLADKKDFVSSSCEKKEKLGPGIP
jgi:hypothetical protein